MSGEVVGLTLGSTELSLGATGLDYELVLDPVFESLMPAHSPEELAGLTDSIISEGGCHEPCYAWPDHEHGQMILLDGYTRIKICQENHLPDPELTIIELPDRACCYGVDHFSAAKSTESRTLVDSLLQGFNVQHGKESSSQTKTPSKWWS